MLVLNSAGLLRPLLRPLLRHLLLLRHPGSLRLIRRAATTPNSPRHHPVARTRHPAGALPGSALAGIFPALAPPPPIEAPPPGAAGTRAGHQRSSGIRRAPRMARQAARSR